MPSENASSKKTTELARNWIRVLGLTAREYRVMLSHIRGKIGIVESFMSSGNWSDIEYNRVPSIAMKNYRKAFSKQDADRFMEYLEAVKSGKNKINSAALYPYQLYNEVQRGRYDATIEEQWKALPDYVTTGENFLVMADVSGSMSGDPMAVSVSLALYSAEHNKGDFKNLFLTFSSNPQFVQIKGRNLKEKMDNIENANWNMSTNLRAAFRLILNTAVNNNVPEKDMPTKLFVITDMEFDRAGGLTNIESIKREYRNAGYTMPVLVFWNVNARGDHSPCQFNEQGIFLVSGLSPSIFKSALETRALNPYDMMVDTLNNERYSAVDIAINNYFHL
jgi:hypothetical protein